MYNQEYADLPKGLIYDIHKEIMILASTKYKFGSHNRFYYEEMGEWLRSNNEYAESEHKRLFKKG